MALSLLQGYDSDSGSSSEDDITVTVNNSNKRNVEKSDEQHPVKKLKSTNELPQKQITTARENKCVKHDSTIKPSGIPLPASINAMFIEREKDIVHDDPSLHDGRIRSFAHEKNNWASYVYIDLQDCELGILPDQL